MVNPLSARACILAVLRIKPLHGRGMMESVEHLTGNGLKLQSGALYPALAGLRKAKLIVEIAKLAGGNRPQPVYKLSEAGEALARLQQTAILCLVDPSNILGDVGSPKKDAAKAKLAEVIEVLNHPALEGPRKAAAAKTEKPVEKAAGKPGRKKTKALRKAARASK